MKIRTGWFGNISPRVLNSETYRQETIQQFQSKLNDRSRAILDYRKPDEVFNNLVALKE